MAAGGVLLLRIAVVSAAAFLAGALVFRTISGTFPSEIGGVVFAEAAGGLEKLGANVAELTARLDASDREIDSLQRAATGGVAAVNGFNEQIDAVWLQVERLSEAVVALGDELRDLRSRGQ